MNETQQTRRYERYKWSTEPNKQSETKLYPSIWDQKQQCRLRSCPPTEIVSSSKTSTSFSEKSIRKALLQAFNDVEEQLRKTKETRPSLEEQNQEQVIVVSELKITEPKSAAQIQENRTEIPTITKDRKMINHRWMTWFLPDVI